MTKEEEREFWELCGFRKVLHDPLRGDALNLKEFPHYWFYPDGQLCGADSFLPSIHSLDALKEYAMPVLDINATFILTASPVAGEIHYSWKITVPIYGKGGVINHKSYKWTNPNCALALAEACYKVLKK